MVIPNYRHLNCDQKTTYHWFKTPKYLLKQCKTLSIASFNYEILIRVFFSKQEETVQFKNLVSYLLLVWIKNSWLNLSRKLWRVKNCKFFTFFWNNWRRWENNKKFAEFLHLYIKRFYFIPLGTIRKATATTTTTITTKGRILRLKKSNEIYGN